MNLFFSSLAIRTAKARPIPEEQPVMRTTFWFIVPAQCSADGGWKGKETGVVMEMTVSVGGAEGGSLKARSIIRRSATQQKP